MVFKSTKRVLCSVFVLMLQTGYASATIYDVTGSYEAYDPTSTPIEEAFGTPVEGSYNDATGIMDLNSIVPFFGQDWTMVGDITTTPGSYDVVPFELAPTITGIEVGEDQWLGVFEHTWGVSTDTVVLVWDVTYLAGGVIQLTSTDVISDFYPTGSGAPGHPTVGGATTGFSYSVDLLLTPVPVPAAVWLFGSGLLGLIGVARRKR